MGKLEPLMKAGVETLYDLLGLFQPKVGDWYSSHQLNIWSGSKWTDYPADLLTASYYPIFRKIRVDRIHIYIAGAGGVGAKARIGIYDDKDFYPNSLIVDAGEVDASTMGTKSLTIDETLDVGKYWLAFTTNDSTIDLMRQPQILAPVKIPATAQNAVVRVVRTYGTLPDLFPAGGVWYAGVFMLRLRVAEVF